MSLAGGCGKAEGNAGPVSRAELPARVASIACDGLAGCCKSDGFAFDLATCKQAFTAEIDQNLNQILGNDNVVYDERAAGECLAALSANTQCGEIDDDDAPACDRVFRGRLAPGEPCTTSEECREDVGQRATCTGEGLTRPVCTLLSSTPARAGQEGEPCFTTCYEGDDCSFDSPPQPTAPAPGPGVAPAPMTEPVACYRDQGLWCDYDSGYCRRLAAVGEACSDSYSCSGDAFCDYNTQLCASPRPNGVACDGSEQCQSGRCGEGGPSIGVPNPGGAPVPTQVCVSRRTVSAEECAQDLQDDSVDDSGSSGDSAPVPGPAPALP
jgi:hypothetical protein